MIFCEYCDLEVKDHEFKEHQIRCGSRTNKCEGCNKYVQLRFLSTHKCLKVEDQEITRHSYINNMPPASSALYQSLGKNALRRADERRTRTSSNAADMPSSPISSTPVSSGQRSPSRSRTFVKEDMSPSMFSRRHTNDKPGGNIATFLGFEHDNSKHDESFVEFPMHDYIGRTEKVGSLSVGDSVKLTRRSTRDITKDIAKELPLKQTNSLKSKKTFCTPLRYGKTLDYDIDDVRQSPNNSPINTSKDSPIQPSVSFMSEVTYLETSRVNIESPKKDTKYSQSCLTRDSKDTKDKTLTCDPSPTAVQAPSSMKNLVKFAYQESPKNKDPSMNGLYRGTKEAEEVTPNKITLEDTVQRRSSNTQSKRDTSITRRRGSRTEAVNLQSRGHKSPEARDSFTKSSHREPSATRSHRISPHKGELSHKSVLKDAADSSTTQSKNEIRDSSATHGYRKKSRNESFICEPSPSLKQSVHKDAVNKDFTITQSRRDLPSAPRGHRIQKSDVDELSPKLVAHKESVYTDSSNIQSKSVREPSVTGSYRITLRTNSDKREPSPSHKQRTDSKKRESSLSNKQRINSDKREPSPSHKQHNDSKKREPSPSHKQRNDSKKREPSPSHKQRINSDKREPTPTHKPIALRDALQRESSSTQYKSLYREPSVTGSYRISLRSEAVNRRPSQKQCAHRDAVNRESMMGEQSVILHKNSSHKSSMSRELTSSYKQNKDSSSRESLDIGDREVKHSQNSLKIEFDESKNKLPEKTDVSNNYRINDVLSGTKAARVLYH
eukprot:GHVL01019617.1.p1 GENE.GHVL01019617.1~~GHVL01019617.1.p1  ORF type:complete len:780 (-),score=106.84 GHVL01019617.1:546-2885(-)